MNNPPNNPKYKQGVYVPKYPQKLIGNKAIYRSGLELKFFRFCDFNPNIVQWGSENVVIPYISPLDGKMHRYYVDNYVAIKEGNIIKKYLIEIKPFKQTLPPTTKYRKRQHLIYEQSQYIVNQAKWESASKYCKQNNLNFLILTENELNYRK